MSIRCSIRTARLPFYFEKRLTLRTGSPMLEVDEFLVNEGRETVPCVWGEHIALGAPTLSGDSVIDLPGGTLINHPDIGDPNARLKPDFRGPWPWTEDRDGNRVDLSKVPPPSIEAYDMSYVTDMPEGWYGLTNLSTGVGVGVVFPKDVFEYLWYWQSLGGGYGYPWYGRTYNVGLEPFTSFANDGLGSAIENGTALNMEPGQRVDASVKVDRVHGRPPGRREHLLRRRRHEAELSQSPRPPAGASPPRRRRAPAGRARRRRRSPAGGP